jgi:hypothetical protein
MAGNCTDCDKPLMGENAVRCHSCENRRRWAAGEMHRSKGKNYPKCPECNAQLKSYKSKRCPSCAAKQKHIVYRDTYRQMYDDPEWREGLRERTTELWQTEEYREKIFAIIRSNEYRQAMSDRFVGENNPNWHDGASLNSYNWEFNPELKMAVRTRDGFQCQLCGCPEKDHAHDCHHINYDKDNNEPENLVTLCRSCHSQTNCSREFWQRHFEAYMKGRATWKQLSLPI